MKQCAFPLEFSRHARLQLYHALDVAIIILFLPTGNGDYAIKRRECYIDPRIADMPYDPDSIMHYSPQQHVWLRNRPPHPKQGQTLTQMDIDKLHLVYPPQHTPEEVRSMTLRNLFRI